MITLTLIDFLLNKDNQNKEEIMLNLGLWDVLV